MKKMEKTDRADKDKGDGGIGKYDGGLEADEAKREEVTGEAGRLLEMDSGSGSG
jgi:aurora kinase